MTTPFDIPEYRPGPRKIDGEDFNALVDQVRQAAVFQGPGEYGPMGLVPAPVTVPEWQGPRMTVVGRITATDGGTPPAYSWTLLVEDSANAGLWIDDPQGVTGGPTFYPAYERSGNVYVPVDGTVITELHPSSGGPWMEFVWDGSQSIFDNPVTFNNIVIFNEDVTFNEPVTFNVGPVTYNVTVNFGFIGARGTPPPGIFSKPTLTVTGAPTWTPAASTYPLLWGAFDHIEWEWDSAVWVPFVSTGRTAVANANYTAVTTDRVVAYTSITAARVVTLPQANTLPAGFILRIVDESGFASTASTISCKRSGGDGINGAALDVVAVNSAFGYGSAETDGVSEWTVEQPPSGGTPGSTGRYWEYHRHQGPNDVFNKLSPLADDGKRWFVAGQHVNSLLTNEYIQKNWLLAVPFISPGGGTITKLAIGLAVNGPAGCKATLGIYKQTSATNKYPHDRIFNSEEKAIDAGAPKPVYFINDAAAAPMSFVPDPGTLYWMTLIISDDTGASTTAPFLQSDTLPGGCASDVLGYELDNTGHLFTTNAATMLRYSQSYNTTLPNPFPSPSDPANNSQATDSVGNVVHLNYPAIFVYYG